MARNKLDLIEAASRRPKNKTIPMTERYRGETKAGPACKQQLGPPCAPCCRFTHIPEWLQEKSSLLLRLIFLMSDKRIRRGRNEREFLGKNCRRQRRPKFDGVIHDPPLFRHRIRVLTCPKRCTFMYFVRLVLTTFPFIKGLPPKRLILLWHQSKKQKMKTTILVVSCLGVFWGRFQLSTLVLR